MAFDRLREAYGRRPFRVAESRPARSRVGRGDDRLPRLRRHRIGADRSGVKLPPQRRRHDRREACCQDGNGRNRVAGDPIAAVPVLAACLATIVAPSLGRKFYAGSVGAYAVTPQAWKAIVVSADA